MKENGNTTIRSMVCKNKVGFADTPPGALRKGIQELDERNKNARFLQGSRYGMHVKRLSELPPIPKREIE